MNAILIVKAFTCVDLVFKIFFLISLVFMWTEQGSETVTIQITVDGQSPQSRETGKLFAERQQDLQTMSVTINNRVASNRELWENRGLYVNLGNI